MNQFGGGVGGGWQGVVAGPQSQGPEGSPPGASIGKPETRQGRWKKQEEGQKGDRRNDKGTQWVGSICSAKPQVATTKGLRDAQHGVAGVGATLTASALEAWGKQMRQVVLLASVTWFALLSTSRTPVCNPAKVSRIFFPSA